MLIYLHGFNSSPGSAKAQLVKARMEALGRGAEFVAPAVPASPTQASAAASRRPLLLLLRPWAGGHGSVRGT